MSRQALFAYFPIVFWVMAQLACAQYLVRWQRRVPRYPWWVQMTLLIPLFKPWTSIVRKEDRPLVERYRLRLLLYFYFVFLIPLLLYPLALWMWLT